MLFKRGDLVARKDGILQGLRAEVTIPKICFGATGGFAEVFFADNPEQRYIYPRATLRKLKKGE